MKRQSLRLICWICCICFGLGSRAEAEDDWSGKRVMVVGWTAELKAGNEVVSQSRLGDVFEVDRGNGPWLWIKDRGGWINQSDVVLYDRATEHFTSAINNNATAETYHQRAIVYSVLGQPRRSSLCQTGSSASAHSRKHRSVPLAQSYGDVFR